MNSSKAISVLFVCMGNICRSPTAEGLFRDHVSRAELDFEIRIDSAGTHAYHVGEPPDPRATRAARKRGIDISHQRARAVEAGDFHSFNYILAMDSANLERLSQLQPVDSSAELNLLLNYCQDLNVDAVPDPYYGGASGFEHVLDLLDTACSALVEHLRGHQKP